MALQFHVGPTGQTRQRSKISTSSARAIANADFKNCTASDKTRRKGGLLTFLFALGEIGKKRLGVTEECTSAAKQIVTPKAYRFRDGKEQPKNDRKAYPQHKAPTLLEEHHGRPIWLETWRMNKRLMAQKNGSQTETRKSNQKETTTGVRNKIFLNATKLQSDIARMWSELSNTLR